MKQHNNDREQIAEEEISFQNIADMMEEEVRIASARTANWKASGYIPYNLT